MLTDSEDREPTQGSEIAIVGMAGRFPGARNVETFWRNLCGGVELIHVHSDEDLRAAGVDEALIADPHYVRAGGVLEGVEEFDAAFFGFYPREAEIMDPQHRVFLECAWEALEDAGYDPGAFPGPIGVFAGSGMNTYLLRNLLANRQVRDAVHPYQLTIGNDKDFLPTRVSYKLNLKGPGITVQTACSTSLVAIHVACQSLLNYQCDMALSGGVAIRVPQKQGYLYQEGGIASADGRCRAFDARAGGTVCGNGVGIVVLKRLEDALAEGCTIYAVIKSTAINNDGAQKVGFTAPGVEGQAEVIAAAHALAEVEPETIAYVEAHGTGTALGDPIEIAALETAFGEGSGEKQFCAIGSLKTNVGHLDAAAGVAGLIKTALALRHGILPPSLHCEEPNPKIDWKNSPFFVNTRVSEWPDRGCPRRAGVSSFGIGGTNAHAILEEAPVVHSAPSSRPWQILPLSARGREALNTATANLAAHLEEHPELNLADAAYTLQVGRRAFVHRRFVIARDPVDAERALVTGDPSRVGDGSALSSSPSVAFMFTGQGSQYVDMARELYQTEALFRETVDLQAKLLQPHLGIDPRRVLFPEAAYAEEAALLLDQTLFTQPALFVIEYALASLFMSWGVRPGAMLGHSIGEYVAACLAGVFSLEDALALVAARGRLMQSLPAGAMLSVPLSEAEIQPYLDARVALAAVNAPSLCVLSGPTDAVEALEARLSERGVECRRLRTSHAFHSSMMEPCLSAFTEQVAAVRRHAPSIPFLSNVTGTWITPEEATDPQYWARHLRGTVRFADGVGTLLADPSCVLLEVGPGKTLATLARMHPAAEGRIVLPSLRHPKDPSPDPVFLLGALGCLWVAGVPVSWSALHGDDARRRVPLPTYPFERRRYWVEPDDAQETGRVGDAARGRDGEIVKRPDIADWLYVPSWKRSDLSVAAHRAPRTAHRTLVFTECDLGSQLAERLRGHGHEVVVVRAGARLERVNEADGPLPCTYTIEPGRRDDYETLIADLKASGALPERIVHLWSVTPSDHDAPSFDAAQRNGFYSLLYLAQALAEQAPAHRCDIVVISTGVHEVTGEEALCPQKVTLLGPCRVIAQECPGLRCRVIDVPETCASAPERGCLLERIIDELTAGTRPSCVPADSMVAYRGRHRWIQTFEPLRGDGATGRRGDGATVPGPLAPGAERRVAPSPARPVSPLRERGVYLITGGLGRVALALAEHMARSARARLVLVGRSPFPARDEWERWVAAHGETDRTSRQIRQLQAIEALGGEVRIVTADVADACQMRAAVTAAHAAFGALHGVFHAAGVVGDAALRTLSETGVDDGERQFAAKAWGLMTLATVLEGESLDFCLLCSSLATVLGGLGFAAYAAGNAFMDAFAHRQSSEGSTPWISVNWDAWRFEGESPASSAASRERGELWLSPEEGGRVFDQILAMGTAPQIVVSTGALAARLERWSVADEAEEVTPVPSEGAARHPRPNLETAFVAPRSELETRIAALWDALLGIEPIGVEDDFFALGGHSLLATQLVSRLRDSFRVKLPLRRLFEQPTIAGLAACIEAEASSPSGPEASDGESDRIEPVSRDGELPLSFGQQRLWFLDQLEPGSPLYSNFAAVRLTGALNVAALERSLNEIVRRHEVLRTLFVEREGRPTPVIQPEISLPLPVEDLSAWAEGEREARVIERARREAGTSFDLSRGPLLSATLLRLGEREHVLLFTMHHIISDGWSVAVLLRELTALYPALAAGRPSPLSPLAIQYADYAHWQARRLEGEFRETQLAFWREQLGDEPPPLDLPTDRPRPAVQTSRGANLWFELPEKLSESVAAFSRTTGVTPFMTLTAALLALLSRITGQDDLCLGTPIAGRGRSETEGLIGFLLNTLVIRMRVEERKSFRDLVLRVRDTSVNAFAHQELPFEMLVEALQPRRDLSRAPFFQVMFDLQEAPLESVKLPELVLGPIRVDGGTAKFDLALSMEWSANGLRGYWNYNADLFDAETIRRIAEQFRTLLEGAMADPERTIPALPLLTEAERHQVLVAWNDTETDAPPSPPVHAVFAAAALHAPEQVALVLDDSRLTYGELNRRANQLARALVRRGVGPETADGPLPIVALCVERSMDMVVGIFGILKAGGAFLPIDPANPAERIAFMLADSGARLVLTQSSLRERLWALGSERWVEGTAAPRSDTTSSEPRAQSPERLILLDTDWPEIGREREECPETVAAADDLAYVIYTSGSTGEPKGVLVPHGAIADHCRDIRAHYELTASDRILQFASFSFDQALEQILGALTAGATLVLRGPEIWEPELFGTMIDRHELTVVNLPPAYWSQWVQSEARRDGRTEPGNLRLVIVGGDVLLPETLALWRERWGGAVRLLNAYGPTETTITALTCEVPATGDGDRVPVGRPLPNRRVYILDRHGSPAPIGVPGELYIGGLGVARGYLNRPELTAEKFVSFRVPRAACHVETAVANAAGETRDAQRLYRTGDRARWLADGQMEFLGRIDDQVKIRGFRVEPGEIEAAIRRHPAVQEAVVVAQGDGASEKHLAAYLVTRADAEPALRNGDGRALARELRAFLRERLPDYMLPAAMMTLPALPLTTSGKVDRRALPAPDLGARESGGDFVAPRNEVEAELARIWAGLLGREQVGVEDDFFELGGHSLLATQLASRVREAFPVDLPLRRVFETPTVAGLATLITEQLGAGGADAGLDAILAELEQLSDEDARALLED